MKRNDKALPGSSSRDLKLESHTASNVVTDRESDSSNEKMETHETDAPGSSNAEVEKYKCLQCPKQYKYKTSLTAHMKIHDKNTRFECEVCDDKVFVNKQHYDRHLLPHTGVKSHKCPICKRCFGQSTSLKRHQYIHLKEKTFKCLECPVAKYFQTPNQLSNHMLVNHNEKQHECSICYKKFHRRRNLKQHQIVHTIEKPSQCEICGKMFSRIFELERHVRSHTGEKPYKCELCGKGFTVSCNLKRHEKSCAKRTENRPHKCVKCPKRYSNKRCLITHMKTHKKETTN